MAFKSEEIQICKMERTRQKRTNTKDNRQDNEREREKTTEETHKGISCQKPNVNLFIWITETN